MSSPEFNPTDEAPIDREEWEKAMGTKPLHDLFPALIGSELLPEAQAAAIEWINLYCEAAELEDHDCLYEDFMRCPVCDQIKEIDHRAFSVSAVWQKHWAAGILRAFELAAQPQPAPKCPKCGSRVFNVQMSTTFCQRVGCGYEGNTPEFFTALPEAQPTKKENA